MTNPFAELARIENPRDYPQSSVDRLGHLLRHGRNRVRDPRRHSCYELEGNDEVYYFHVSPFSGDIVLIAMWPRPLQERYSGLNPLQRADSGASGSKECCA